jgi:hypothetical protein
MNAPDEGPKRIVRTKVDIGVYTSAYPGW